LGSAGLAGVVLLCAVNQGEPIGVSEVLDRREEG
jgi:hypothetical protein